MFKTIKNFIKRIRYDWCLTRCQLCEQGSIGAQLDGNKKDEEHWNKKIRKYNERLNKIGDPHK